MMVLGDINLEELMGEEYTVILKKNPKFGFDLILMDEGDSEISYAEGIHADAIENFASFCRRFLSSLEACEPTK